MQSNDCGEIWVLNPNIDNVSNILAVLMSINGVSLCCTVFLNASALVVIWQANHIPGSDRVILLSLSLANLLSGLISQVLWLSFMATQLTGNQICAIAKGVTFFGLLLGTVSFSVLVLASIERYLCIFHPFVHERISRSRTFAKIIVCLWFKALSISLMYPFPALRAAVSIGIAATASLGCCAIAFIYARVCYLAYKVHQQIQDQARSVHNCSIRRQQGSIKMTAFVVGLTVLLYLPCGISLYMMIFARMTINVTAFNFLCTIAITTTAVDPICYFILNRTIRRKLIALWRCTFRDDVTEIRTVAILTRTERM